MIATTMSRNRRRVPRSARDASRARPRHRGARSAASRATPPRASPSRRRRGAEVQPLWALLRVQRPRALHGARGAGGDRRGRRAASSLLCARAGPPARRGRRRWSCCRRSRRCSGSPRTARGSSAGERVGFSRAHASGQARARWTLRAARRRRRARRRPPSRSPQPLGRVAGRADGRQRRRLQARRRTPRSRASGSRACSRAPGCPRASLRVVHGHADVGGALVEAPVAQVRFTGSPRVGRAVAEACARAREAQRRSSSAARTR